MEQLTHARISTPLWERIGGFARIEEESTPVREVFKERTFQDSKLPLCSLVWWYQACRAVTNALFGLLKGGPLKTSEYTHVPPTRTPALVIYAFTVKAAVDMTGPASTIVRKLAVKSAVASSQVVAIA